MSYSMNASKRSTLQASVRNVIEALESRQYLTGLGYGLPVNTATASLGLSPVSAGLFPLVTGSTKADLVVANSSNSVSVLLSNGDGSFNSNVDTIAVTGAPLPLAVGDFNGDGIPDIVAGTTGNSTGDISIILGNGDGTFKAANNVPALSSNHAIAVAAFITGAAEDIISVSNSASNTNNAAIIFGNGSGGAISVNPFSLPFGSASAVATGDFNEDGKQDFVVVGQQADQIGVFLGNGDGTFKQDALYATGAAPTSIAVGNFRNRTINSLPELDIAVADSTGGQVSFLTNSGDGTFAAPVNSPVAGSPTGGGPLTIGSRDLNSDGIPDLICLLGSGASNQATALLGNGDGTFRTGTTISVPGGSRNAIAAGDLVGAGTPSADLVLTNSSQITALLNIPAGPASQVAFAQGPVAATTTATLEPITVDVEDANGILVSTDHSNVTLSISAGATLGGTITEAAVNGVATFSDLSVTTAGNYTLTASDGVLSPATSAPFSVTVATSPSPLVPTLGHVILPPQVVAGAKLTAKLPVIITNRGSAFKGSVTVHVFADTGTSLDGNQVLIASQTKKLFLKAGKGKTLSFTIESLPPTLGTGIYHLLAEVVDPSSLTNVIATTQTVQVAAAFVQPAVSLGSVIPATIVVGKSGSILVTVINDGNLAASGVDITLSPSADGVTPITGIILQSFRSGAKIQPNKTKRFKLKFKTTSALPAGTSFPYVSVSLGGVVKTVVGTTSFTIE